MFIITLSFVTLMIKVSEKKQKENRNYIYIYYHVHLCITTLILSYLVSIIQKMHK